jgi:ABC-2 type transport system permease protein
MEKRRGEISLSEKVWMNQPTQTFTVTVDQLPTRAGIDPYNKLIDRNADDSLIEVTKQ